MANELSKVLIAIGSSIEPRISFIHQAITSIDAHVGRVLSIAPLLESLPLGGVAQGAFYNTAIVIEIKETPESLLKRLQGIELQLGRQRKPNLRWGDRTIDLDIILWLAEDGQSLEYHSPTLDIPHAECTKRLFVLEPACVIASQWIHPGCNRTLENITLSLHSLHGTEPV